MWNDTTFIEFIPDVNIRDKKGNTALHYAVEENQSAAIQCLLYHKADPNIHNDDMMAPLHKATQLRLADAVKVCLWKFHILQVVS